MQYNNPAPLSVAEFQKIRDIIRKRFGITFSNSDRYLVETRLSERLLDLEADSFEEYTSLLDKLGDRELTKVIDTLTNNETYFFREDYQLNCFSKELLPKLKESNQNTRTLTVWSAGCSSGEEAYTIAMLMVDSGLFDGWRLRVFGNDVSSSMVGRARSGTYRQSSFRNTPANIVRRHFCKTNTKWTINEDIKSMCNFAQFNILDENAIGVIGNFDVIFCRNVLMYFDKESRSRCIDIFGNRLNEEGFLLLGHTESLLNLKSEFQPLHLTDTIVYEKPKVPYG